MRMKQVARFASSAISSFTTGDAGSGEKLREEKFWRASAPPADFQSTRSLHDNVHPSRGIKPCKGRKISLREDQTTTNANTKASREKERNKKKKFLSASAN